MSLFNNHARFEALVTEHLDGLLDEAGEARLRLHLESCADCAAEVADQQALLAVLHAEPMVEAPRSFALPYATRTAEAPVSRVSKLLRSMQVATAAAALVLVFLVGINIAEGPGALDSSESSAAIGDTRTMVDAESAGAPGALSAPNADDKGASFGPEVMREFATPDSTGAQSEPDQAIGSVPPQTAVVPVEAVSTGRSGLEWALIAMSGFTGVLALGVVAATWVPRRNV